MSKSTSNGSVPPSGPNTPIGEVVLPGDEVGLGLKVVGTVVHAFAGDLELIGLYEGDLVAGVRLLDINDLDAVGCGTRRLRRSEERNGSQGDGQ